MVRAREQFASLGYDVSPAVNIADAALDFVMRNPYPSNTI